MEKTPAACAMNWSIQLEKKIRSKNADKLIEAIKEIGRNLEWWNRDSELTLAEYKFFGLVPCEDKLFLNAIFLRLADAFRLGDKRIKSCIVKLFMSMTKKSRKRKRGQEGILSKSKVENYLELLRRVKVVFDSGDVEERTMSLVLFGCWANFAKDCADIRYIILSSLVSNEVMEVKASLFAAGCFCEHLGDFANVYLELLTKLVTSCEVSRPARLAGARAFGKMKSPSLVADCAYKTGLKLLDDSSEEEFSTVMLISLSEIASNSTLLITPQIKLLTSFLSEERSLHVQTTSLKCLYFILTRGVFSLSSVQELLSILNVSAIPESLGFEVLKIFQKVLLYNLSTIPCMEILELVKNLLKVVDKSLQSSLVSRRVLVIQVLADFCSKLLGGPDLVNDEAKPTLASLVVSFVFDRISKLVLSKLDSHHCDLDMEIEAKNLLDFLLNLVEKHSYLGCLMLNRICLFIDDVMKIVTKEKADLPNQKSKDFVGERRMLLKSKLMLYLSKVVIVCLKDLEANTRTSQVLHALKLQIECVCHCSSFDPYVETIFFLLLHLLATYGFVDNESNESKYFCITWNIPALQSIHQLDMNTLECAKKILGSKSYWCCYKAAKRAASQGAWFTAASLFEYLSSTFQFVSSHSWLKCLAQFSQSEKRIQLFLLQRERIDGSAWKFDRSHFSDNLIGASNTFRSAEETLGASDTGDVFHFQRWFLSLQARVLKTLADLVMLSEGASFVQDKTVFREQKERSALIMCMASEKLKSLIYSLAEVSCRLRKLAREFDLLMTSSVGMDRQSQMIVSSLALNCSLLAFISGFAFLTRNLNDLENFRILSSEKFEEPVYAMLIEDLLGRLRNTDSGTTKYLVSLLKSFPRSKHYCFPLLSNPISDSFYHASGMQALFDFAINGIMSLRDVGDWWQDDDSVSRITYDGLQLLLNVISKWMTILSRTPDHFFKLRPFVYSELFAMNSDGEDVNGMSVPSGSHISLSLCLKLKDTQAGVPVQGTKVYCTLNCGPDSQITSGSEENKSSIQLGNQDIEVDELVDLKEQLLHYLSGPTGSYRTHHRGNMDDTQVLDQYVCFQLNEKGQGFCTCLLDVSGYRPGSYRIKWQCCYIDSECSFWTPLPLNAGPVFTIRDSKILRRRR